MSYLLFFSSILQEWKEFALSIKEKYEKLVQTFKQKTNEMYDTQARWQHENLLLKEKYQDLRQKYEQLSVSLGEVRCYVPSTFIVYL